jgi:hypothetical protein
MNNPKPEEIKYKKKLKWRDQNVDLHAFWTINRGRCSIFMKFDFYFLKKFLQ